jgi:CheY-like chemotaxis protein
MRTAPPAPAAQKLDDWHHEEEQKQASDAVLFANTADDDRANIGTGDRVLLIVENDLAFAKVLLAGARSVGFKGLVTSTGASALTMAREFHPSVITLDIHLPDMSGWRILDRLKGDLVTRHIPICVVSTDDARDRALRSGALGFLAKPLQSADEADAVIAQLHAYAERRTKRLAVVMPPSSRRWTPTSTSCSPRTANRPAMHWPAPTRWWWRTRCPISGPRTCSTSSPNATSSASCRWCCTTAAPPRRATGTSAVPA